MNGGTSINPTLPQYPGHWKPLLGDLPLTVFYKRTYSLTKFIQIVCPTLAPSATVSMIKPGSLQSPTA